MTTSRHAHVIGDAPRTIVCADCRRPNEITLGRYHGARVCPRCRLEMRDGVIAQGPVPMAPRRVHSRVAT